MVQRTKFLLLFFLSFSQSMLMASAYSAHITDPSRTKSYYFVKLGAYTNPQYARETLLSTDLPLQIIHLHRYYSVVSQPFEERRSAQSFLKKVRRSYPDAYIIKLSKIQKREPAAAPKPAPVHQPKPQTKSYEPSLFTTAVTAFRQKSYEEALALFDRLLIEQPNNAAARSYYAKTLLQLGFPEEAEKEFQKLLQTKWKEESCKYLKQIAIQKTKARFHSWISVGAGYDDNINLTTDRKTTQYGPYLLQNDTRKTDSTFATAAFGLTHTYKAEKFTLYTTLYSYNELLHTAKGNNLNLLDLSTAVIKKFQKFSLIAPVGTNIVYLGGREISHNLYTAPSLRYQATRHLQLKTSLLFNDNHTVFAKNRDYLLFGGGAGIRYRNQKWEGSLDTGVQKYDAKEDKRYDIAKNIIQGKLYAGHKLFKQTWISITAGYEESRFTRLDTILGYKRRDKKSYYALSLTQKISPKKSVTATYRYTDNNSNINTYSYTKNNYTLEYKHHF